MRRLRSSSGPGAIRLRAADRAECAAYEILSHCIGPTLDIGCGAGQLGGQLVASGRITLGIATCPETVAAARARGVAVLQRSVFDTVPGEGRWQTALLLEQAAAIGGDQRVLLNRVRDLLAPHGRVLLEVANDPADRLVQDELLDLAAGCGLGIHAVRRGGSRVFAVLER